MSATRSHAIGSRRGGILSSHFGVIHGDPRSLGNYTVRDNFDLNLLDYGCIRAFRPKLRSKA